MKKNKIVWGMLCLDFIKLNIDLNELANFYFKDTATVFVTSDLKTYLFYSS